MRTIEIRCHSYTKRGEARGKGSHLSQAGVDLARQLGETIGPFNLVLTSPGPRAIETALAMGFAIDALVDTLGTITPEVVAEIGHHDRWTWEQPFVRFARLNECGGPTAEMGRAQLSVWKEALDSTPEDGGVLVISHGRVIESGLVAAVRDSDFASWGTPFQHCEGVCLTYKEGHFLSPQILRVELRR